MLVKYIIFVVIATVFSKDSMIHMKSLSERHAKQLLNSVTKYQKHDLERECVEEACDKEEFLEGFGEARFGEETVRYEIGPTIFENTYNKMPRQAFYNGHYQSKKTRLKILRKTSIEFEKWIDGSSSFSRQLECSGWERGKCCDIWRNMVSSITQMLERTIES